MAAADPVLLAAELFDPSPDSHAQDSIDYIS
jgi:hypothetical protein